MLLERLVVGRNAAIRGSDLIRSISDSGREGEFAVLDKIIINEKDRSKVEKRFEKISKVAKQPIDRVILHEKLDNCINESCI